jgi:hypothetical protein
MARSRRRSDVPADPIPLKGLQLARLWLDGHLPPFRATGHVCFIENAGLIEHRDELKGFPR